MVCTVCSWVRVCLFVVNTPVLGEASSRFKEEAGRVIRGVTHNCRTTQQHGSTTWKRWCRRDSKGRCRVCHVRRHPKNCKEQEGKLKKGKRENNLGTKDRPFRGFEREQRSASKVADLADRIMIQYKQQMNMWELLVKVIQCQVRWSWIQEQHHRRNSRWVCTTTTTRPQGTNSDEFRHLSNGGE